MNQVDRCQLQFARDKFLKAFHLLTASVKKRVNLIVTKFIQRMS